MRSRGRSRRLGITTAVSTELLGRTINTQNRRSMWGSSAMQQRREPGKALPWRSRESQPICRASQLQSQRTQPARRSRFVRSCRHCRAHRLAFRLASAAGAYTVLSRHRTVSQYCPDAWPVNQQISVVRSLSLSAYKPNTAYECRNLRVVPNLSTAQEWSRVSVLNRFWIRFDPVQGRGSSPACRCPNFAAVACGRRHMDRTVTNINVMEGSWHRCILIGPAPAPRMTNARHPRG